MDLGIFAKKFFDVCGEWLEEEDWLSTRSKVGVFSSASVVWLGIQQRLTGNSMQSSLTDMVTHIRMRREYPFVDKKSLKVMSYCQI